MTRVGEIDKIAYSVFLIIEILLINIFLINQLDCDSLFESKSFNYKIIY
jgi:hypothetical protein